MPNKLLIITDDAGESQEIYYAKHRFEEAGWQAVIGATQKKVLHSVIHDFEPGWNTYIEKPGYLIPANVALSRARAKDFTAAMLIGGRAPEFLRHEANALRLVRDFAAQKKWIYAVCHGIQILAAPTLIRDRNVTCYRNVRLEAEQAGANWRDEQSVVDREARLITAQTWQSHPQFYRDIFANLEG